MASTPIIDAIVHKQTHVLEMLAYDYFDGGKMVNTPDPFHMDSPLHYAANYRNEKAVDILLRKGANVHAKNKFGLTALHMAAWHEQPNLVAKLVQAGADINALDSDGLTPLHYAVHNKNPETANMLIRLGARPFIRQEDVGSAVDISIGNGLFTQLNIFKRREDRSPSDVEKPGSSHKI